MSRTETDTVTTIAQAVRERAPLVQCIANYVSMDIVANVLNAIGASPAMVHDANESGEFARIASALAVNIGTPSPPWVDGMTTAVLAAREAGTPWVLDPVAVGATLVSAWRSSPICSTYRPTVIRGNASEIISISTATSGGRGVDSSAGSSEAAESAATLARARSAVVVVTGSADLVSDGTRTAVVHGGDSRMPHDHGARLRVDGARGSVLRRGRRPLHGFDLGDGDARSRGRAGGQARGRTGDAARAPARRARGTRRRSARGGPHRAVMSLDLRLYLVTDPSRAGLPDIVSAAVGGGVTCVQVRDKDATPAARASGVQRISLTVGGRVPVVVDDDIVAASAADGVHVGVHDVSPVAARAALGPAGIVGWSINDPAQLADRAQLEACDYVAASPVWSTPTKLDAGRPLGLDGVRELAGAARGRLAAGCDRGHPRRQRRGRDRGGRRRHRRRLGDLRGTGPGGGGTRVAQRR